MRWVNAYISCLKTSIRGVWRRFDAHKRLRRGGCEGLVREPSRRLP